ncbi:hypothetical protein S100390_v1c04250 [Spiroplasma sp. NBRC 100390]|uniref:hypothetical protein n=1 Tax=unclassified Spiroplasma TaxID=2637901 RepID=UPI0008928409|nr:MULTISPECIES: hypothetical protein [unclassified Spiroplasma]AOX43768.1 hypothetical protein STU14_v1c04250 [Spiroplasma sp. TU-14]APE13238.1 hypothetical protein S100390_v1c04250 [Spiroplasma sp. NBRC 100390]
MMTRNFGFTRFWIVLSSIVGIVGITIAASAYFYFLGKYNNGTFVGDIDTANTWLMNSYADLASYKVVILLAVIFSFFTTIICNIGLIRYAIASNDAELCANKWSLAVLSLSLGGFFAPFALTWLPDTDVKATKNARVVIVRYLGTAWLVSALVSIAAVMIFYNSATNKVWVGDSQRNFAIMMGVLAAVSVISLILVPGFYSSRVVANMMAETSFGKWLRFVSTIYTVLVTIMLIIQIITALLKLIEAFGRMFQKGQNGLSIFANILNFTSTLIGTIFMVYLITKVIKGLWRREDGYMVNIPQYKTEDRAQRQF